MKFPYSLSLLWVAVQAKPIVELVRGTTAAANADPGTELLVREGIKLSRDLDGRGLQKRVEAAFPLDRSWNNEVLFGGYVLNLFFPLLLWFGCALERFGMT